MQRENIALPENFDEEMQYAHDVGHSLIMLAIDNRFAGVLEMHAAVRPEVSDLLASLRKLGVKHFAIVSGDHRQPTQKLAETLGMDDYFYDVLPQNKADIVEKLQAEGRSVCFVGDGVNDTIAMKKANISISLSGATSVATDTAQIVLMDASLKHLPELVNISLELNKNLYNSWLFNIIPGTLTIFSAFALRIDIIVALLLSQGGLGLGIVNAMLPLRQISEKERLQLQNRRDAQQLPKNSKNPSTSIPTKEITR
jgi:Cu2+-exporting ATPase